MKNESPVFDRATLSSEAIVKAEWAPSRSPSRMPGVRIVLPGDGPTIDDRLKRQAVHATSSKYSGQYANDNQDWPLAKLLRTEGNAHCLDLAERYRLLHDIATAPVRISGHDASEDIFLLHRADLDDSTGSISYKAVKTVGGKPAKAELVTPGTELQVKALPKLVAKKYGGDALLLARIDAMRELAYLRGQLGDLIDPFEAAVVEGVTLEKIGRGEGISNKKGAVGGGRALVFRGFEIVDRYWQRRRAA